MSKTNAHTLINMCKSKDNEQVLAQSYKQFISQKLGYRKPLELLTKEDWERAKKYFMNHPSMVKYANSTSTIGVSFIKVNSKIYVVSPGYALGEGGYGRVQLAIDDNGNKFAIKATGEYFFVEPSEAKVLKKLEQWHGVAK